MAENQITGRVYRIEQTQTYVGKKDGREYTQREMVLDATTFNTLTGDPERANFIVFRFAGKNLKLLDDLTVGDVVTVNFYLQGNKYIDREGMEKVFTVIYGTGITMKKKKAQRAEEYATESTLGQTIYQQPKKAKAPVQGEFSLNTPRISDDGMPY